MVNHGKDFSEESRSERSPQAVSVVYRARIVRACSRAWVGDIWFPTNDAGEDQVLTAADGWKRLTYTFANVKSLRHYANYRYAESGAFVPTFRIIGLNAGGGAGGGRRFRYRR